MRRLALVLVGLSLILVGSQDYAQATLIDFEGLPLDYYYFYGNQNLSGYYSGVTFGPGATILDAVTGGYYSDDYPPHSWSAVLFTSEFPYIDIVFDNPVSDVSFWYTSAYGIYLKAYADDTMTNMLGSSSGGTNIGTNSLLTLNLPNIKAVKIHDSGNFFSIDDFSYTEQIIPEPATMSLLGLGILGVAGLIRRKRV